MMQRVEKDSGRERENTGADAVRPPYSAGCQEDLRPIDSNLLIGGIGDFHLSRGVFEFEAKNGVRKLLRPAKHQEAELFAGCGTAPKMSAAAERARTESYASPSPPGRAIGCASTTSWWPKLPDRRLIASFSTKYGVIPTERVAIHQASQLREQYSFSYWDSLVVACALHPGCTVLYPEDMRTGLLVANRMTIVNPFSEIL